MTASFLAFDRIWICAVLLLLFSSTGYSFRSPLHGSSYRTTSINSKNITPDYETVLADDSLNCVESALLGVLKFTAMTSAAFFSSNIVCVPHDHISYSIDFRSIIMPSSAGARNLPVSNGASGANRGTAKTLAPILELRNAIDSAIIELPNISKCEAILTKIPLVEKDFKRLFDEHSEGISYKQQFLDQNAFLVYYTKGFDGPGRPSIEDEDSTRYAIRICFCETSSVAIMTTERSDTSIIVYDWGWKKYYHTCII